MLWSLVEDTSTNGDGKVLYRVLRPHLERGEVVHLSLAWTTSLSSSFLNSSIGRIIKEYGYQVLRDQVALRDYTPPQARRLHKYVMLYRGMMERRN